MPFNSQGHFLLTKTTLNFDICILYDDNQMTAFLIFTFHDELEVAAGLSVELLLRHQALGLTKLGQDFPLERWLRGTGINQFEIQPSAPWSTPW